MKTILVQQSDLQGLWPCQIEEDKSILKIESYIVISDDQKLQLIEEINKFAPSYSNDGQIPVVIEGKDNKKIVFTEAKVTVMSKEEYMKEFPYDTDNDYIE